MFCLWLIWPNNNYIHDPQMERKLKKNNPVTRSIHQGVVWRGLWNWMNGQATFDFISFFFWFFIYLFIYCCSTRLTHTLIKNDQCLAIKSMDSCVWWYNDDFIQSRFHTHTHTPHHITLKSYCCVWCFFLNWKKIKILKFHFQIF